jgi:hypothetical protein
MIILKFIELIDANCPNTPNNNKISKNKDVPRPAPHVQRPHPYWNQHPV